MPVKSPWIFPGASLKVNISGAPGNIQGNLTGMHHLLKEWTSRARYRVSFVDLNYVFLSAFVVAVVLYIYAICCYIGPYHLRCSETPV